MTTAKFRARITVEDGGTQEVEIWDDELSPFGKDGKYPIRDWVSEHFGNYSNEELRDLLDLPPEGNFEVLIEGTINGHTYYSPEVGTDYDEDVTVDKIQKQQIPDSVYEGLELGGGDEQP